MDAGIVQDGHEGINYSNIVVVLATPMILMLAMLFTATDPDAVPAPAPAAVAAAPAAIPDDLVAELRRRGHTETGAALIAARFTTAVPDATRRRELALLASQLTTSLRMSDDEASTKVLTEATKVPDPAAIQIRR